MKQMVRRNDVVFAALILMTAATLFAGCTKIDQPAAAQEAHAVHAGHGEDDHGSDLSMSLEEILVARCEHDVFTYECTECRYEVGVVRIDASLLSDPHGSPNGLLRTTQARTGKIGLVMNVTGEVRLNENVAAHISPRITGVIRSVNIDIGQQVKRDDVLLEIDSVELGQTLGEYARNKTLSELSRKHFEREKSLYARQIGSEQEMIDAQMAFKQHQINLTASEHKLQVLGLSQEDIAAVELNDDTTVASTLPLRAPIDGRVIQKHAVIGELVQPGDDILLIADLDSVWVWADIYAQDLAPLLDTTDRGETLVSVSVPAFPKKTFRGVIDYVGATMDEQTRTVKVRATVDNENRLLRPGMFCEATIVLDTGDEGVVVPAVAVLTDEAVDFVFMHMKDDYYVRRPVTQGRDSFETVEIIKGLRPGETIVADGAFLLKSDVLREKLGAGCAD